MTYVRYIDKTTAYYKSQGYEKSYKWAHFDETAFAKLSKPLSESTLAFVSTSEIAIRDDASFKKRSELPDAGSVYSIPASVPSSQLYSRTHSYDAYETTLDDVNAYFPVDHLHAAVKAGRIGALAPNLHGVYNAYSQRRTREIDAPEVLRRCREDKADVALLVPV
jgi:hypothetical protein